MERSFDTIIRISSARAEIVVEQEGEGVTSRKTLTPEAFSKALLGSRFDDGIHSVGFLPAHCFSAAAVGKDLLFFLRYPELRADVSYYGTEYPDFPLPRLVFSFKYAPESGKVIGTRLAVTADERLTPNTLTFVYPFSNVYGSKHICLGNNALPVYKDPTRLHTLMRYILSFPNNNDMFHEGNNRLNLGYRDLLEHLKDKDPSYYYESVLIPDKKTLKDFMEGGT